MNPTKDFCFEKFLQGCHIFKKKKKKLPYLNTVPMIEVNWHQLILNSPSEKNGKKRKNLDITLSHIQ